jgi:hypothetical protein
MRVAASSEPRASRSLTANPSLASSHLWMSWSAIETLLASVDRRWR